MLSRSQYAGITIDNDREAAAESVSWGRIDFHQENQISVRKVGIRLSLFLAGNHVDVALTEHDRKT